MFNRKRAMLALMSVAGACNVYAQSPDAGTQEDYEQTEDYEQIEEVVVRGEKSRKSAPTLLTTKLTETAGTLGDPLRGIFSLPGVVQLDDQTSEPAVRGSGPQDNEFLIDFLPTGYLFHIYGDSTIDENLLHDFGLQAAGFGPQYGNATGAVFDIRLRDPRPRPIRPTIELSLWRAAALVEGAITENQAFYASYRQSLIQHFLPNDDDDGITVNKHPKTKDYQFKYQWRIDPDHRLTLSAMGAADTAAETIGANSEEALLDPGGIGRQSLDQEFVSTGLLWEWNPGKWQFKTGAGFLNEESKARTGPEERESANLKQITLRSQGQRQFGAHALTLGIDLRQRKIQYDLNSRLDTCTDFNPDCENVDAALTKAAAKRSLNRYAAYLDDRWTIGRFELSAGLRFTNDDYLDETFVEPRLGAVWRLSNTLSLNTAVGRYHKPPQPQEILPIIGNPALRAPVADHFVAGFDKSFAKRWSLSFDAFYKTFDRWVTDTPRNSALNYVNGASGKAHGVEFMLNKNRLANDRWYGWLSLAWSKSERTLERSGITAPYFSDVPLVVNLVGNYRINDRWSAGLRWIYRSGLPYTPIVGNRPNLRFPGRYLPVYGALNSRRGSAYHRLDLRVERRFEFLRLNGSVYLDVINAYNNDNFRSIEYQPLAVGSAEFRLVGEQALEFFPLLGVKVSF